MSMLNLPKRRLVDEVRAEVFEMKVNALSDAGYTMEAFAISPGYSGQDVGESYPSFTAVMKLDMSNYEGVTNLRDVFPEAVDDALAAGWEIASASISTKFVRMIKRKKV